MIAHSSCNQISIPNHCFQMLFHYTERHTHTHTLCISLVALERFVFVFLACIIMSADSNFTIPTPTNRQRSINLLLFFLFAGKNPAKCIAAKETQELGQSMHLPSECSSVERRFAITTEHKKNIYREKTSAKNNNHLSVSTTIATNRNKNPQQQKISRKSFANSHMNSPVHSES